MKDHKDHKVTRDLRAMWAQLVHVVSKVMWDHKEVKAFREILVQLARKEFPVLA